MPITPLEEYLDYLSKQYYKGTPVISDKEFDYLADLYNYSVVGSKDGTVSHKQKMYSLKKSFVGESVPGFAKTWAKESYIETPKLDGAAISLYYVSGDLRLALTRGDGITGQPFTNLILDHDSGPSMVKGIHTNIPNGATLFISGELVAPKYIPNARNYAAGATNLKDPKEFNKRALTFIAYDCDSYGETYYEDMQELEERYFFKTVVSKDLDFSIFPQDGVVRRLNNNKAYKEAGFTTTHPKGAYAVKNREDFEVKQTTLLDVTWQVGHTGQVTPVGHFEPVELEGANVTKASLANAGILEALDLSIGDTIEVTRSGGIIPKIIRRVD